MGFFIYFQKADNTTPGIILQIIPGDLIKSTFFFHAQKAQSGSSPTVVETLYRNKSSLEAIFRIIDKDNSGLLFMFFSNNFILNKCFFCFVPGYISLEEFSDACTLLREHMPNPITQEQLVDICRLMDMNKDGLVDLNEFLETFRLVDMKQNTIFGDLANEISPSRHSEFLNNHQESIEST